MKFWNSLSLPNMPRMLVVVMHVKEKMTQRCCCVENCIIPTWFLSL